VILVDTGSSVSLIQPGVSASQLNQAVVTPFGVTGDELRVKGEQRVTFTLNGKEFVHVFCVCTIATEVDAILGMDFLRTAEACLDFDNRELRFKETAKLDHNSQAGECCEVRETTDRVLSLCLLVQTMVVVKETPVSVVITNRVSHRKFKLR